MEATDEHAGLAPFATALRDVLDEQLLARGQTGTPPAPAPRRRKLAAAVGIVAAAAASLVLWTGTARPVRRSDGQDHVTSAAAAGHADPQAGTAHRVPPPGRRMTAPVMSGSIAVEEDAAAGEQTPEEPGSQTAVPGDSRGPTAAAARVPRADITRRRRQAADEGRRLSLEEEVQMLWQRGELAAAEQKLREVLRVADGRRAELAYGDLFALVRQTRGSDGQTEAWREYLAKFPRGSFAEDARAGLCQRSAGEERVACWREYLAQYPDGAHRAQAEIGRSP